MNKLQAVNNWGGYRNILLPLGHKADVNNLTTLASLLVDHDQGKIDFLHVIEEGNYSHLPREWRTGSKRVTESHHMMMKKGIHSQKQIVTAKSIVAGILNTAGENDSDAIILGWGPKPKSSISNLASNILSQAGCDVIIFKNRNSLTEVEKILYPVALEPGKNRLQLIGRIVSGTGADLTFTHVTDSSDKDCRQGKELLNKVKRDAEEMGIEAETLLVSGKRVADEIAEVSKNFDLMILGPSNGWWLKETLFGQKTDKIAIKSQCSVLMHKHPED